VHESDLPRRLVDGHVGAAPLRDLLLADAPPRIRLQHHEGERILTAVRVRNADYAHLRNGGMAIHDRLHLRWKDAEAGHLEHVLLPLLDAEVPVLVDVANVAGEEPAVAERPARGVGIAPV